MLAVSLLASALAAGCGGNDGPTTTPPGGVASATSSGAGGAAGAGGAVVSAASSTGSGGEAAGSGGAGGSVGVGGSTTATTLGSIPLAVEPDVACIGSAVVPVQLYAAGVTNGFDRTALVGSRRMASSVSWATGFVTFDADGANPSAAPITIAPSYNVAASEGATIGIAGASTGIVYRRYDAQGVPTASALTVATESPLGLALGGGSGQGLVVWAVPGTMRARGVTTAGALAGPAFDFGANTVDTSFSGSVAYDASGFAVAWTGARKDAMFETAFVKASTTAAAGSVVELATAPQPHAVQKIVKTSTGYALLINADLPPKSLLVVILDATGKVTGPARVLGGAVLGWDLAALGSELAVVARRPSGEPELRPLDATGAPIGPWVCLEGPIDDMFEQVAIDADGTGYAVVYRDPFGAEMLLKLNHLGQMP